MRRLCGAGLLGWLSLSVASAAEPTLRDAAKGKLMMGVAIMASQFDEPLPAALISTQFDCITPGNEMKPDALQNVKGKFTFAKGDKIVAFAKAHDMKVIGHTLVWHNQSPKWLFQNPDGSPLPRAVALANLEDHINHVVSHYRGQIHGWDVVNEAVSDADGEYLRDTPARRAIGDDYVVQAFKFAHAADPDVELYLNDFNNEQPGKRERCLRLLKELKAAGCRVDAVGIQGHWLLEWPAPELFDEAVKLFAAEGVKIAVTELDIDVLPRKSGAEVTATEAAGADPYKSGLPPEIAAKQAERYGQFMKVALKHRGTVTRVTVWGTDDGHTWLNDWPVKGRTNHPMLFDRDLKPKPAMKAVLDALQLTEAR